MPDVSILIERLIDGEVSNKDCQLKTIVKSISELEKKRSELYRRKESLQKQIDALKTEKKELKKYKLVNKFTESIS